MKSRGFETAKEVLRDVHLNMPYNPARIFAERDGLIEPAKLPYFGGNCIHMAQQVSSVLTAEGYAPQGLREGKNPYHHAVICEIEGTLYYLDPMILTEDPIELTSLFSGRLNEIYSPSFYCNRTKDYQIKIVRTGENGFSVLRCYQDIEGHYVEEPMYTYDLSKEGTITDLPSPDIILDRRSSQFDLRALLSHEQIINLWHMFASGTFQVARHTAHQPAENGTTGTPNFEKIVQQLADKMRLGSEELLTILQRCKEVYIAGNANKAAK